VASNKKAASQQPRDIQRAQKFAILVRHHQQSKGSLLKGALLFEGIRRQPLVAHATTADSSNFPKSACGQLM